MLELIYGHDALIIPWMCDILKVRNFGKCTTIGIVKDKQFIGAALFNNYFEDYNGKPISIELTFATLDKRWASRAIIYGILSYPFLQLRVQRVQLTASKRDKRTRDFNLHMGFKYEGTGRQAWHYGGDACVYSMLRHEFLASKWNIRGKIISKRPGSTRSECSGCSSDTKQ